MIHLYFKILTFLDEESDAIKQRKYDRIIAVLNSYEYDSSGIFIIKSPCLFVAIKLYIYVH